MQSDLLVFFINVFLVLPYTGMEILRTPFRGIVDDIRGRAACYKQDWIDGRISGIG